ncbi:hypothetical protein [Ktedonospora formicarum]|uniref:Uncharacterized protein n=1 Tax=Ktedonospora formicarum TaxID=2778364 RepID=A0A8J3MYQ8_9CHLR|nr:hypothetical protein [Ktedonospora formicarum]GHO49940.1 hypothetical protein KSX_81030 [Ktedonospora formicarum]
MSDSWRDMINKERDRAQELFPLTVEEQADELMKLPIDDADKRSQVLFEEQPEQANALAAAMRKRGFVFRI